jgi:hypothetical protein
MKEIKMIKSFIFNIFIRDKCILPPIIPLLKRVLYVSTFIFTFGIYITWRKKEDVIREAPKK